MLITAVLLSTLRTYYFTIYNIRKKRTIPPFMTSQITDTMIGKRQAMYIISYFKGCHQIIRLIKSITFYCEFLNHWEGVGKCKQTGGHLI